MKWERMFMADAAGWQVFLRRKGSRKWISQGVQPTKQDAIAFADRLIANDSVKAHVDLVIPIPVYDGWSHEVN